MKILSVVLLGFLLFPLFALRAQQVTLPLARYEELRARANPDTVPAPAPPAPFALEAVDLAITVGPTSARVVQSLTLTLYAAGWQTVPLGKAGSFVASRLGDLDGRVVVGKDGSSLVVRGAGGIGGKGRHRVELESVLPVTRDEAATRPTWKLALETPDTAVVRGRLTAPPEIEGVAIEGAGLARRLPDGSWEIVGAPGAVLGLTLTGRQVLPERATLPLRFEVTSATATVLSRTAEKVHGWIEARIAQGRLERLVIPLPEGLKPVAVTGPLAGWNVEGGKLVVTPLTPAETALAIELDLTGPSHDALVSPVLVPEGSGRTLLFSRVALTGDGILELDASGAGAGTGRIADEAEAARQPAAYRSAQGQLMVLPDPRRPSRWAITWAEKTEVLAAQIDRLRVDVLVGESGRATYDLWAEVRNRGAQQLTLTFPAGFELAAGSRDGAEIATGVAGVAQALAVPLAAGEGAQVVHLRGVLPLALPETGDLTVPLPGLSAPAARVEVRALLPGGRTYTLADPGRAGTVGPPPVSSSPTVAANASAAANQLSQQVAVVTRRVAGAPPLGRPAGFVEMQAAWSALSASPASLVFHVKSAKEKDPWF
jgi:hypothetical protein